MNVKPTIKIEYNLTLSLTEVEARALDGLVGYGFTPFLSAFYEKLGQTYMKPHESGLKSLFEAIQSQIPGQLHVVDDCRKKITEALKVTNPLPVSQG